MHVSPELWEVSMCQGAAGAVEGVSISVLVLVKPAVVSVIGK